MPTLPYFQISDDVMTELSVRQILRFGIFFFYYSKLWTEEPDGLQSMGSLRVGHN